MKQCVVLLSGGLDSATVLAVARDQGFECCALSFDYGQRHAAELAAAREIAGTMGVKKHFIMKLDLRCWGGSALTSDIPVPEAGGPGIPVTYVPARNMIFLSCACSCAESMGIRDIFIGVNQVDYSGYPDCRREFIASFAETARLGTCACDQGWAFTVHAPLQNLSKGEIIALGTRLGVDYSRTVSCYDADERGRACGRCDSCALRKAGFAAAGVPDPTRYR